MPINLADFTHVCRDGFWGCDVFGTTLVDWERLEEGRDGTGLKLALVRRHRGWWVRIGESRFREWLC